MKFNKPAERNKLSGLVKAVFAHYGNKAVLGLLLLWLVDFCESRQLFLAPHECVCSGVLLRSVTW